MKATKAWAVVSITGDLLDYGGCLVFQPPRHAEEIRPQMSTDKVEPVYIVPAAEWERLQEALRRYLTATSEDETAEAHLNARRVLGERMKELDDG